jgi:nucleotide-binding universal stress UspA family protein
MAAKLGAKSIVVGSHGKGMLQRALLGSVSSYLAQHTDRPLVIVPSNTQL